VLLLQSLLPHLALTPPAAAEQELYIINLYKRMLSRRSIEQPTKISRDNKHCVWLYSLSFVVAVKALRRALVESVYWVHGHGIAHWPSHAFGEKVVKQ
jgi:hypothetical protein